MCSAANHPSLRMFLAGITEQTFSAQLGMADPPLIDYLTELLARFLRMDAVFRVRATDGRRLENIAEMLVEAESRTGNARREVHRHIGDFALFWTGIYPEALGRLQGRDKQDHFLDYYSSGKRSYYIASTIPDDEDPEGNAVLERLSHDFGLCAFGLTAVRREWERRDGDADTPPGPYIIDN